MGPIQIPPVPRFIILTDRADGTLWWLTYNLTPPAADGFGYISITTASPQSSQESITYAAFNEPYIPMDSGFARLIVRSGFLGVDASSPGQGITDIETLQIYARKGGLNIPMRRLILSSTTDKKGALYSWVPFTTTQTPNPT
jgi:hypothetical protein